MDETPNLGLPYIMASQAQKHVTHNEATRILDAVVQLSVLDRDLSSPPGAPSNGDRYIVGALATGDWSDKDHQIAVWQDNAWVFHAPLEGWLSWVADEDVLLGWDGSNWVSAGEGAINPAPFVGVNTTAADPNKLAVKSDAVLFSHDDVTPGSGDIQTVLNKKAASNTSTFLFQDNWSGRAEIGLAGDDDFHFKVSPDGSSWHEGILIDKDTGVVSFPSGGVREILQAPRTYFVNAGTGNNGNDGLSAGSALETIAEAVARCYKIDSNSYGVFIQLADGAYDDIAVAYPMVGGARLEILGNPSAPQNVVINAGAYHTTRFYGRAKTALRHMQLQTANTWSLISLSEAADIYIDNIIFRNAASRHHIEATDKSSLTVAGNYTVSGGARSHLNFSKSSAFNASGKSVTVTGTPDFSDAFASLTHGANYYIWNMTWSGAATGKRYDVRYNATCNGGSATHFPGDVAGTTASGGQYGW